MWDRLSELAAPLAGPLVAGTSAGIAYHLLVDATLQPAAYHGLPWHMPMHDYEAVMGANGVAEGAYAAGIGKRNETHGRDDGQCASAESTLGRRVVDGIAKAASEARNIGRGWLDGL